MERIESLCNAQFKRGLGLLFCIFCLSASSIWATNIDSLRTAIKEFPADTNSVEKLIKIAGNLRNEGNDAAEEFARAAVGMAIQIKDSKWKGEALATLGTVYHLRSNFDQALSVFLESDKASREANYEQGVARAQINIGAIYLSRKNNQLAKKHLLDAKEIVDRLDIKRYMVSINTNLAIIYTKEGLYEEAMALHQNSLALLHEADNARQLAICYTNIGYLYETQDSLELALKYYRNGYESAKAGDALYYEGGFSLQNMVNALATMKRVAEGEKYVKELIPIIEKAGSPSLRAESYRSISNLKAAKKDYKEAFRYFELFYELQDSLVNIDQNEKMAEMQKEYDIFKRDAKIARIEKEAALLKQEKEIDDKVSSQRVRYMFLMGGILILLLIASVVLFIVFTGRSKALRELQASHAMIDQQKAEIELQNQALKLQNERLEDLNREKDGLVGIVAHDLKSPLNKALALAELLSVQGELNASQLRSVSMMQKVGKAGNDLIRDLLDLNAVEHPDNQMQITDIDLQTLFAELHHGFEGEAKRKGIRLDWRLDDEVSSLRADRNALVRVMDNLVSNAMKFSSRDTAVFISGSKVKDGGLEIIIADEGPGISAEDQKKLFKKFQRLSAQPTGGESSTGLGLAITKALVEKLGGTVTVESELGKGTKFILRFLV